MEQLSRSGSAPSAAEDLKAIETLLGAKVRIALKSADRLVASADLGATLAGGADESTAQAILVGVIQGMHRQRAGRFPEVVLSAPIQDASEGPPFGR